MKNTIAAAASPTTTKTPVTAPLLRKKLKIDGTANVRRKRERENDWTYAEAPPLPPLPFGIRVGLLITCVTVMGSPNEFVETTVDVKADGAESVVDPSSLVVVT
jgi:hypothetical protein